MKKDFIFSSQSQNTEIEITIEIHSQKDWHILGLWNPEKAEHLLLKDLPGAEQIRVAEMASSVADLYGPYSPESDDDYHESWRENK